MRYLVALLVALALVAAAPSAQAQSWYTDYWGRSYGSSLEWYYTTPQTYSYSLSGSTSQSRWMPYLYQPSTYLPNTSYGWPLSGSRESALERLFR